MTVLSTLWLPILLSSVFVFVFSSLVHMFFPWHKGDYAKLPEEDKVMDALRPFAIPPGDYMIPRPYGSEGMKSPEFAEKMKKGPVVIATVIPSGPMAMGKSMGLWFVYILVVGYFAGYIALHALPAGARYTSVFRFSGLTAFLAYSAALWQFSIWYHRSWCTTLRFTVDGLIYAGLTAGTFGWLWPR